MYSTELEEIIDAALADGVLTDKEKAVLFKRAHAEGIDIDEFEVVLEGRLAKMKKKADWLRPDPPKSIANQKMGNVVKCPSCGAQVVGGSAVCPECGYAFSNVSANSSAEKLANKLEEFNIRQGEKRDSVIGAFGRQMLGDYGQNAAKQKMELISSFPVPNTRADLLEFLTMIQAKAKSTGPKMGIRNAVEGEDLSYAYWLLFANCINKAKISFANDPAFAPYFEFYEKQLSKTKGFWGYLKTHPMAKMGFGIGAFFIVFILVLVICVNSCDSDSKSHDTEQINEYEEIMDDTEDSYVYEEPVDEEMSTAGNSYSSDWDEVLDEYEDLANKLIKLTRSADNGDIDALTQYADYMDKLSALSDKLDSADDDMSPSQMARYEKITLKMAQATM